MSTKKKFGLLFVIVAFLAAIMDAVRYLKPDAANKQVVFSRNSFPISSAEEIILVYNAWGGIYPGIVDFINKEFFPASYPCNLCYQTFGTFTMKEEWNKYLARLPYKKTELHKDDFQRKYQPENLELPVILIADGNNADVLLSAKEINKVHSLDALIQAVNSKLKL